MATQSRDPAQRYSHLNIDIFVYRLTNTYEHTSFDAVAALVSEYGTRAEGILGTREDV